MGPDVAPFPEIDRLIHEPARLAILMALASCQSADFHSLRTATGLSGGNLSVQLSKLQKAGLIRVEKGQVDRKSHTTAALSRSGAKKMARYWKTMNRLRKSFKARRG